MMDTKQTLGEKPMMDTQQTSDERQTLPYAGKKPIIPMYVVYFPIAFISYVGYVLRGSVLPDQGFSVVLCCALTVFIGMDLGEFFARRAGWAANNIALAQKIGVLVGFAFGIVLGLTLYHILSLEFILEFARDVHENDEAMRNVSRAASMVMGVWVGAILGAEWVVRDLALRGVRWGIVGGLVGAVIWGAMVFGAYELL